MTFAWLDRFLKDSAKTADYAEKTLAAYRLGMKAKGSVAGVRILSDPDGCDGCRQLDSTAVYHPDDAPRLPLPECDQARACGCVYRPVMTYQMEGESQGSTGSERPDGP
jgi:hypothetical protein